MFFHMLIKSSEEVFQSVITDTDIPRSSGIKKQDKGLTDKNAIHSVVCVRMHVLQS